ncbi:hypothetical protein BASA50_008014 [Batrachochytrium salamandrivorans]|uniref:Aspergillus nuclease S(1) n=1 Tax=Batrachochytrium salamandrivorans TaxID=1357716 RepID=A0ABQ8F5F4_9FUNG|nr:hypothetical protein BASA50_008014 [Batrachochytrium salamandrivorans]
MVLVQKLVLVSVAVFSTITGTAAYGRIGHWLSGRIAQELLSNESALLAKQLLPQYHGNLADAASWADVIKSKPEYIWSKNLHFINPINDHPPEQCSYNPGERDCPDNHCIVAAIHNYTRRLISPPANAPVAAVREESLKFLLHYIGDLHQPLHVTGRDRGGNSAQVRFNGRLTSLHGVWDSLMFEKRIREDFGGSQEKYAAFLVQEISTTWRAELPSWISCPAESESSTLALPSIAGMESPVPVCPERWARYSNIVNCVYVWKDYKRKYEISGKYYQNAIPIAEKMLAQAALRFAAVFGAATMVIGNDSSIVDTTHLGAPAFAANRLTHAVQMPFDAGVQRSIDTIGVGLFLNPAVTSAQVDTTLSEDQTTSNSSPREKSQTSALSTVIAVIQRIFLGAE